MFSDLSRKLTMQNLMHDGGFIKYYMEELVDRLSK